MTVPALPFSKIRRAGALMFLSGEMPIGPDGQVPEGIAAQTTLALDRVAATLPSAGLALTAIGAVRR